MQHLKIVILVPEAVLRVLPIQQVHAQVADKILPSLQTLEVVTAQLQKHS